MGNTCCADIADMQFISKYNKGINFFDWHLFCDSKMKKEFGRLKYRSIKKKKKTLHSLVL